MGYLPVREQITERALLQSKRREAEQLLRKSSTAPLLHYEDANELLEPEALEHFMTVVMDDVHHHVQQELLQEHFISTLIEEDGEHIQKVSSNEVTLDE